jgi:hypothetical protein
MRFSEFLEHKANRPARATKPALIAWALDTASNAPRSLGQPSQFAFFQVVHFFTHKKAPLSTN